MFHPMQITILFLRIANLVNVDFLFEKTLSVEYYDITELNFIVIRFLQMLSWYSVY